MAKKKNKGTKKTKTHDYWWDNPNSEPELAAVAAESPPPDPSPIREFARNMSDKTPKKKSLSYMRFLTSDTVSLRADGSDRLFRIHRGLLAMKCKPVSVALERKEFRESEGVYTFKEVSEGTVMRFIEWAYTGEYPAVIDDDEPVELGSPEKPAESAKEVSDDEHNPDTEEAAKRSARTASQNHPLLTHIRLYIFGHIFLIQELQNQAFDKVTACFTDMSKPDTLDKQLAVISALRMAFLKLPAQDRLLDWLAQYAAYCLGELRRQATFHNLLETSSLFGSRLILWLSPASSPPWRLDHPEPDYPHYVPEPIPEEAEPSDW